MNGIWINTAFSSLETARCNITLSRWDIVREEVLKIVKRPDIHNSQFANRAIRDLKDLPLQQWSVGVFFR